MRLRKLTAVCLKPKQGCTIKPVFQKPTSFNPPPPPPIRASSLSFFTQVNSHLSLGEFKAASALLQEPLNVRDHHGKWHSGRIISIGVRFSKTEPFAVVAVSSLEQSMIDLKSRTDGSLAICKITVSSATSPKPIAIDPIHHYYHRIDVEGIFSSSFYCAFPFLLNLSCFRLLLCSVRPPLCRREES
jgi:hypothetical protein